MLLTAFAALAVTVAGQVLSDTAKVVNGRLVVTPINVSFIIPPRWMDTTRWKHYGQACDLNSARAQNINTDRNALRSLSGGQTAGDRDYSAVADSVFPLDDLVAHLGEEGWRECASSFGDLQIRVYVSDSTPNILSRRLQTIGLRAVRAEWSPVAEATRDSAGWQIDKVTWTYNGYDYVELNTVEALSRIIRGRTTTLLLMYSRGIANVQLARRAVLESFVTRTDNLGAPPGLDSIVLGRGGCLGDYCEGTRVTITKAGEVRIVERGSREPGRARFISRTMEPSIFDRLEALAREGDLYSLPERIDFGAGDFCRGEIKPDATISVVFYGISGIEKQIRDNHGCPEPSRGAAAPGILAPFDRLMSLRAFERTFDEMSGSPE